MSDGHIFVSYGRGNSAYVRRLVTMLARAGVDVWYDRDIPAGDPWSGELQERVKSCRALLLVMSPDAAASPWVTKEIQLARDGKKQILPLWLAGDIMPGIEAIQAEDVRDGEMPSPAFVDRLRGMAPRPLVIQHQIGLVPAEADCFQHRQVAEDLDAALAEGKAAILTSIGSTAQILSGLGGVGKTQLAASLARRLRDTSGLDLLVWVTAKSQDAILATFAQAACEVLGADAVDPPQAATAFLAHLATTTAQWLIVLDDVADPADLDGLWPPRTPTGRTVVTTRRRDGGLAAHGHLIRVDLFTAGEANTYLAAKFADQPHRLVEADDLALDLGFLPVALAQAAAYIADRDLTCAAYRERLAAHPLASLAPSAWPDDYARPVTATLVLSVDLADRLDPPGLATPLLTLLSLLDPNGIPTQLVISQPVVDFVAQTIGHSIDTEQARDALTCLTRLNLADAANREDVDANEARGQRIRVHALVQRAIRDNSAQGTIARAAVAAAAGLVAVWPEVERDTGLAQALRANAAALRAVAEKHLWQQDGHALLVRVGDSLGEAGLRAASIDHFTALRAQAAHRLGADHPYTFLVRDRIAFARAMANDPAGALVEHRAILADRQLGPDHPITLRIRSNIALWRGHAGDVAGALTDYQDLLADQLRLLGPAHPDAIATRDQIAYWWGYTGDVAGALVDHQAVLVYQIRLLGPDHPDTLKTRMNIAFWRGQDGGYAQP